MHLRRDTTRGFCTSCRRTDGLAGIRIVTYHKSLDRKEEVRRKCSGTKILRNNHTRATANHAYLLFWTRSYIAQFVQFQHVDHESYSHMRILDVPFLLAYFNVTTWWIATLATALTVYKWSTSEKALRLYGSFLSRQHPSIPMHGSCVVARTLMVVETWEVKIRCISICWRCW